MGIIILLIKSLRYLLREMFNNMNSSGSDWVAHLVRASSQYAKAAGSVPGQGIYKNQQMNA